MVLLLVISVLGALAQSDAYSVGAPPHVCRTMLPSHYGATSVNGSESTCTIRFSSSRLDLEPGETRQVLVQGCSFKGILIHCRDENSSIVGQINVGSQPQKFVALDSMCGQSITHRNADVVSFARFSWTAPAQCTFSVTCQATIVLSYSHIVTDVRSPTLRCALPTTEPPNPCAFTLCGPHKTCEPYNGRAYCHDVCSPDRCEPDQDCSLEPVRCAQEPCFPTAVCTTQDPCATIRCGNYQECVAINNQGYCRDICQTGRCSSTEDCSLQTVSCITTPCFPMSVCTPKDPCDTVRCGDYQECVAIKNQSYCYDVCRTGRCSADEKCSLQSVTCIDTPCFPVSVCTPKEIPTTQPITTEAKTTESSGNSTSGPNATHAGCPAIRGCAKYGSTPPGECCPSCARMISACPEADVDCAVGGCVRYKVKPPTGECCRRCVRQKANYQEGVCGAVLCPRGQQCVEQEGMPVCQCRENCPSSGNPVCGSDGATYKSSCHLHQQNCRSCSSVTVQSFGECPVGE